MQAVEYTDKLGTTIDISQVTADYPNPKLLEEVLKRREMLLEQLASLDDNFADLYLSGKYTEQDVKLALRNVTINLRGFPIFCGTALRNKGIQMLLDGIVDYLASPLEVPPVHAVTPSGSEVVRSVKDKDLCGLAFKVIAHTEKGPLVYVRLYSGKLKVSHGVKNTSQNSVVEKAQRLYRVRAKEYVDIDEVTGGDVIAIAGLTRARSGDTLIDKADMSNILLPGLVMPPPVFFCSIDADSELQQKKLEDVLTGLCREDPSIVCRNNEESGQLVVMGLGELHLEILRDRLFLEFGIKARLGPVRVAYRESITRSITHLLKIDRPEKEEFLAIKIRLEKIEDSVESSRAKLEELMQKRGTVESSSRWDLVDVKKGMLSQILTEIEVDKTKKSDLIYENEELLSLHKLSQEMQEEVTRCLDDSLKRGMILGYPLINISAVVEDGLWYRTRISKSLLVETCSKIIPEALKRANSIVLEPIMRVEITLPNACLGEALNDIASKRRGVVLEAKKDANGEKNIIDAKIPLVELIGYSTGLRSLSKGEGTFTMEFDSYRDIGSEGLYQLQSSGF